jgi:hypothetical protein
VVHIEQKSLIGKGMRRNFMEIDRKVFGMINNFCISDGMTFNRRILKCCEKNLSQCHFFHMKYT